MDAQQSQSSAYCSKYIPGFWLWFIACIMSFHWFLLSPLRLTITFLWSPQWSPYSEVVSCSLELSKDILTVTDGLHMSVEVLSLLRSSFRTMYWHLFNPPKHLAELLAHCRSSVRPAWTSVDWLAGLLTTGSSLNKKIIPSQWKVLSPWAPLWVCDKSVIAI